MPRSLFETALNELVENAQTPMQEKVASLEEKVAEVDGTVAKSLVKLAHMLRESQQEPTYEDLINFIGGR
jgi:hypothetical protein